MSETENTQSELYIAGGEARGNILDEYSSYTYNLTFSMLPMSFYHSGNLPVGYSSAKTKLANRVIIAQTGVTTKFNIDNLTIESVTDNYGSSFTASLQYSTQATFTITEPLGSSLTTLMKMGFDRLRELDAKNTNTFATLYETKKGARKGPLDLPYLLEVDLVGHKPVDGENDREYDGLEFETVGKYMYPCYLTNFDFNPKSEGTEYNFRLVSLQDIGRKLVPETRMLMTELPIEGETIGEMLSDFARKVNKDIKARLHGSAANDDNIRSHTIDVKLGEKFGGDTNILNTDSTINWQKTVDAIDPHYTKPVTRVVESAPDEEVTGDKEETVNMLKITLPKGRPIKQCITDILSHNAQFASLVTDRNFTTDQNSQGTKKDALANVYAPSIQMAAVAKPKGETVTTGGPAFNITYTIDIKLQAGVQTGVQGDTNNETKKKLVEKWGIVKKYDYMFTGLNDQIQGVDISFPFGQVFLFPEYGGMAPTYQDVASKSRDKKMLTNVKDKATDRLLSAPLDIENVLQHFRDLGSDLKSIITGIGADTKEFITGLAAIKLGSTPQSSKLALVNNRLPSSPRAVFAKGLGITKAVQTFDNLFSDLQELQTKIEGAADELEGAVGGGVNLLTGQIAKIVTEAATPFNFTSKLDGVLGSVTEGIDGLVDNLNDATGLSLNSNDIPGLGEVQNLVDDLKSLVETPPGFNPPPGMTNPGFGTITYAPDDESPNEYLEEMDYTIAEASNENEESASIVNGVQGQGKIADDSSQDGDRKQHYMSTALSYGKTGIPYLAKLRMDIKGDPYWLGRQNFKSELDASGGSGMTSILRENIPGAYKTESNNDRTKTDAAPYDAGSVFMAFRYVFPREYEMYQDDRDSHTGRIDFTRVDMSYTGYYLVTKVTNTFANGQFLQSLDCVKANMAPNKAVFVDGNQVHDGDGNNNGNATSGVYSSNNNNENPNPGNAIVNTRSIVLPLDPGNSLAQTIARGGGNQPSYDPGA